MKKTFKNLLFVSALIALLVVCFAFTASAASESDLTFTLNDDGESYSVTNCNRAAQGDLAIPATHNGMEITSIGDGAFWYCYSLKSITIPDSVTSIGESAFNDCTSLESVTIGNKVTTIGVYAFYGCTSLTGIIVPDSVTSIGDYAFYECTRLENVTIGNNVTTIGSSAFYGCNSLKSAIIGNSVITIGDDAFKLCTSLEGVAIPDSVTTIGDYAFDYCKSLKNVTIGNNVTTIGAFAFFACESLKRVTLPDSVITIGDYAFEYCTSLESVTIGNGVTTIGSYAFWRCYSLKSITIPDSVTSIGESAFKDCTSFESVTIGNNVTIIGSSAFEQCTNIKSVTIGNNVTSIGSYAFCNCTSLTSITIPDSVTSIGGMAFENCTNLESVTIGKGVTTVGGSAFSSCEKLENVYAADAKSWLSIDFENEWANPIHCADKLYFADKLVTKLVIPDGVTSIGDYAFCEYNNIKSVTIPDSVTSIGDSAFAWCDNLKDVYVSDVKSWLSIDFESRWANPMCFADKLHFENEDVSNIIIPNGIISIADYAFKGCSDIETVTIPDSVTTIGDYAFDYCTSLKNVTIGNNVTTIGDSAFSLCENLENVYAADAKSWLSIDFESESSNPIYYANKLYFANKLVTKLVIPDEITSIGDYAFKNCESLKSVTIGNSVTTIGDSAFSWCTSLKSITIPDNVTSIGASAFYYCYSLKSATIGNGLTSIGEYAFAYCELESVIIPDGVTKIGDYAFSYCESIENVTIPLTIKKIYEGAFSSCISLSDVYYGGDKTAWSEIKIQSGNSYLKKAAIHYNVTDAKAHTYYSNITAASLTQNGKIEEVCSACDLVKTTSTIYYPKTITLSSTSVTYNGSTRSPSVTVKDSKGKTLKNGTDYTVKTPSGRKVPGVYEYKITFKGNYSGSTTLKFTILPKAPTTISATQSTSVINLKWSASAGATGYRVYQYSPSKKAYVQIASVKTTSYKKSTNLKAGTEYKFKVKPYTKLSDGTVIWGDASSAFTTATECKAPKITSVTSPSKAKATIKWSNVDGETGFQLYYSTSKNGTYKKVDSYSANKLTTSKTFSASSSGKTIYFKVRAYKKVSGQTIYSEWSAVKSVKLK